MISIIFFFLGEKPFKCEECGRNFIQKEILKRHMIVHTGERPHKCPHCELSFAQKLVLRQHINQKHTENPIRETHECHLCPKVCIIIFRFYAFMNF